MSWQKLLTVNSGKVWFEGTREEGKCKVSGLVDCVSDNEEPFKVWFEKVDYEPEFEVPEQDTGFWVNTYVSESARALKLRARGEPAGDAPPLFRKFCTRLVIPPEGQKLGYIFSTDDLRVMLTHEPLHQGEPLRIFISDREYGESEANFVRFAHFEKPFTLIPDPRLLDLNEIKSPQAFADVLKDKRFYGWPLDRV